MSDIVAEAMRDDDFDCGVQQRQVETSSSSSSAAVVATAAAGALATAVAEGVAVAASAGPLPVGAAAAAEATAARGAEEAAPVQVPSNLSPPSDATNVKAKPANPASTSSARRGRALLQEREQTPGDPAAVAGPDPTTTTLLLHSSGEQESRSGGGSCTERLDGIVAGASVPPVPAAAKRAEHNDQAGTETSGRSRDGRSVARAMAEAILDEGYMVAATSPAAAAAVYMPRTAVALETTHQRRHHHRLGGAAHPVMNGERQKQAAIGRGGGAGLSDPGTSAVVAGSTASTKEPAPTTPVSAVSASQKQQLQQQGGDSANTSAAPPFRSQATPTAMSVLPASSGGGSGISSDSSSGGRGVDAPFGHAVIIEEHVQAGPATPVVAGEVYLSSAPVRGPARERVAVGRPIASRKMGLQTQDRSSAVAVAAVANGGGARYAPAASAARRSSPSTSHRSSTLRNTVHNAKRPAGAGPGQPPTDLEDETDEERQAGWAAAEDTTVTSGNDGFLVLEGGGRSSGSRRGLAVTVAVAAAAAVEGTGPAGCEADAPSSDGSDNLWPTTTAGQAAGLPEAEGGWGHVDTNGLLKEDEDGEKGRSANAAKARSDAAALGVGGGRGAPSSCWADGELGLESAAPAAEGDDADHDLDRVLLDLDDGEVRGGSNTDADTVGYTLAGLPGERSLYLAGSRFDHYAAAGAAAVGVAGGSGVGGAGEEEEEEAEVVRAGGKAVYGDEVEGGDDGTLAAATAAVVSAAAAVASVGVDDVEIVGDGADDDSFGGFEQSWDDLVEGVADEGVLHAHGRAGLPDPMHDDTDADGLVGEAMAGDSIGGGATAGGGGASSLNAAGGSARASDDGRDDDDEYESSCEEQQGEVFHAHVCWCFLGVLVGCGWSASLFGFISS